MLRQSLNKRARWRFCLRAGAITLIAFCSFATFAASTGSAAQSAPASSAPNDTDKNEKVSGLGVILKIETITGERVFQTDGYRVKIATPGTTTSFTGPLSSVTDVTPGTWVRFEGARDSSGIVITTNAVFYVAGTRKGLMAFGPKKAKNAPEYQPVTRDSIVDADGHLLKSGAKVRLSDAGGPCGWHRVPADEPLQERVNRIGMRLVPEYQKQLKRDVPWRISFRFYAVEDDKVRSVFVCNPGLILIPKNVVGRLQNDDQLAAVLADGIAFNLVRQLSSFSAGEGITIGTEVAAFAAGSPGLAGTPGLWLAAEGTGMIVGHEEALKLERKCARIALQLMDDAGYDPWQAPAAWRLLGPKEMPVDPQSLEYTREGKYQLKILNLQYKRATSGAI